MTGASDAKGGYPLTLSGRQARPGSLRRHSIAVFGSFARGQARPDSDLDILVDYREDARPDLFDFIELKQHLEALFDRPVDLATPEALHHRLRERILAEAVYA